MASGAQRWRKNCGRYKTTAKNQLQQTDEHAPDEALDSGDEGGDEINLADDTPTSAEIRSCFRTTPSGKSTPEWAVPARMWQILEEKSLLMWQQMWKPIGDERTYPRRWQAQKVVWLEKPGKDPKFQKNRRGSFLQDGAGKAYLTWLRKQFAKRQRERPSGDNYGAEKTGAHSKPC